MLATDIDKELSVHRYQDQTVFRPWDTFRLLLVILHQYSFIGVIVHHLTNIASCFRPDPCH